MEPGVHLFIGMVNTGKTSVVFQILRKLDVEYATVVCGHEDRIARYQRNFPMFTISDEFDILADIRDGSVVVIDDRLYDVDWYKHRYINELLQTARGRGIRFYITMLYAMGIPPRVRQHIDTIHIFRERIAPNIHRIYRLYGAIFGSNEEYIDVMCKAFIDDYMHVDKYIQCMCNPPSYTIKNIKDGY